MSIIRRATAALLCVLAITMALNVAPAGAHRIDESYIYVDIFDTRIEGRLAFSARDVNAALDLDIPEDDDVAGAQAAFDAARQEITAYASERFGIGTDGVEWDYTFTDLEVFDTENGIFSDFVFRVDESFPTVPDVLDVRYELFFDEIAGHAALFHIGTYWEAAVFDGGESPLNLISPFSASNTRQSFDLEDPSFWKGFQAVVKLGIDDIRIGTDHILFVLALLLPSVMIFRRRDWEPSDGFVSTLWRVLKLATMFTIAHSITLSLAGMGVFELPSKPVEVIIALSIAVAALHNLRPVVANREWALAFVFGLFHGLGFAGLLGDLGLDRSNRVWSLLAFNVGVEIGQVAIILMVFPTLYLLRRTRLYDIGFRVASVAIAVVAVGWMIERVFETDLSVNRLVDPLVEVPRAYGILLAATLAAVGWRAIEQRRGTLRPPAARDDDREADRGDESVLVGAGERSV